MSNLPPPTTAPAGWYPDPYTGGVRYFDGRRWSGAPMVPARVQPKEPHPTLPIEAAWGALVVLTASLIVGKLVVDVLVDYDWPLLVYIVIASLVSYGPSVAWVLYVRRRWGEGRFETLGGRLRWSDVGWGPLTWLTAVLTQAVLAAVILTLDLPFTSNIEDGPGGDDRTYVVALLVAAVVAAPLVEEFVFRGVVLRGFLSRMPAAVAVGTQGPVIVLARTVDADKWLFVQQANEAMTGSNFLQRLHC